MWCGINNEEGPGNVGISLRGGGSLVTSHGRKRMPVRPNENITENRKKKEGREVCTRCVRGDSWRTRTVFFPKIYVSCWFEYSQGVNFLRKWTPRR